MPKILRKFYVEAEVTQAPRSVRTIVTSGDEKSIPHKIARAYAPHGTAQVDIKTIHQLDEIEETSDEKQPTPTT